MSRYWEIFFLYDKSKDIIRQSFVTDTLVPGQMTNAGQKLRSSVSATNLSEGLCTFEVQLFGFLAHIESNPRQLYVSRLGGDNGSPFPGLIFHSKIIIFRGTLILNLAFSNTRFMRFGDDGHLRVYHWKRSWLEEADLLTDYIGECKYPTVFGNYSVCANGQFTCPQTAVDQTNFLQQLNYRQPVCAYHIYLL